jgi:hypothetical protein
MAITYSAGTGTIITSYAGNGTITGATANTVTVGSTLANSNNGQIGTAKPGYTGRLIIIDLDQPTEQTRFVTSESGTGPVTLTLSEDFTTTPSSGDTYHVFYVLDDITTVNNAVNLNSKTGLYEFSRVLSIGPSGGGSAGLCVLDGEGVEHDDNGNSASVVINTGGRYQYGLLQGGKGIRGGIGVFYNNTKGEPSVTIIQLGDFLSYGATWWSQRVALNFVGPQGRDNSFVSLSDEFNLSNTSFSNSSILGRGDADEYSTYAGTSNVTFTELVFANNAGVRLSGGLGTPTVTFAQCTWAGTSDFITFDAVSRVAHVVDPTWAVTSHTDLVFNQVSGTACSERTSYRVLVQDGSASAIANANVIIDEDLTLQDLVIEDVSDGTGLAEGSFEYKRYVSTGTTTRGTHSLRVDGWTYYPFVAPITSNEPFSSTISLSEDTAITETVQSTAISTGASVTWNQDTNPSSIIEWSGGSGTLSVGDTITASGGATGVVTEILSGDNTAGEAHLETRNGTAFANTNTLANGSGWTANYVADSEQRFTIWIDGASSVTYRQLYDYLAALTAQTTLSATGELIHEWGKGNQPRALYSGDGNLFNTVRSGTEGVAVVNVLDGGGNLDYLRADDGTFWTPPTTYDLTVTGVLGNSEIRVYEYPSRFSGGNDSIEAAGVEAVAAITQTNSATNRITYTVNLDQDIVEVNQTGGTDFTTIFAVGDTIRITVRDNSDNPTLELFDQFEIQTVTSTQITPTAPFTAVNKTAFALNNTTTVTLEKVNASQTFTITPGEYDIFIYRIGSLPITSKQFDLQTASASLPISQVRDRVYKNPA